MSKLASAGEWYCPGCGGSGRPYGESHMQWCTVCNGRGTVPWDPDSRRGTEANPLDIVTDGRLWGIGLRNLVAALGIGACLLGLFLTVGIVSTWLQATTGVLRPVLEALPESFVTRSSDDVGGSPWAVAGISLIVPIVIVRWLSVLARRSMRSARRLKALVVLVVRAAIVVLSLAFAMTVAAIAAGADLRGNAGDLPDTYIGLASQVPAGYEGSVVRTDAPWAVALVFVIVFLLGLFSYWRLSRRVSTTRTRSV